MKKVRLSRRARVLRAAAVVAALAVSGIAVSQASYSAFSASTSNTGNSWTTGSLALTSDVPSTTAMFSPTGIAPGQSGSKVVTITAKAGAAGGVRAYAANASDPDSIAQYFTLKFEEGTTSGSAFTPDPKGAYGGIVFNGLLSDFMTGDVSYATGGGNWAPDGTADASKSYRITWTFSADAPDSAQGKTVSTDVTWEIQSKSASDASRNHLAAAWFNPHSGLTITGWAPPGSRLKTTNDPNAGWFDPEGGPVYATADGTFSVATGRLINGKAAVMAFDPSTDAEIGESNLLIPLHL